MLTLISKTIPLLRDFLVSHVGFSPAPHPAENWRSTDAMGDRSSETAF